MDIGQFFSIIKSGEFGRLVGETESDWLECKGEIYLLGEDRGKRELAKDVSSFANTDGGGFILIGIETDKSEQHQVDTIKRIRPFLREVVNIEQYHNVIKEWVYPNPDIGIEWMSYNKSEKGILVIKIPSQSDVLKPFLISKTVEESGKRSEISFGFAERKRANSLPKRVFELYQIFRDGLFYGNNVNKRFEDVMVVLQEKRLPIIQPSKLEEEILTKISDAIMNGGLKDHRKMLIMGYMNNNVTLPEWSDSQSELIKALETPPTLRRSGWGLDTGKRSRIIKGELRQAIDEGYKILDLYRDGTLVFGVIAEKDFLTWGRIENDLRINSLALIETIYNFVTLFKLVTEKSVPKPSEVSIRIKLHDLHLGGEKSFMVPYTVGAFGSRGQHDAPDNNFETTVFVDLSKSEFDLGRVSYHVVEEVYLWFGMDSNMIPYVIEKDGLKSIDPAQIKIIDATK